MDDVAFEAMQAEMAAMREAVQLAKTHRRNTGSSTTERLKSKTQRAGAGAHIDVGMRALAIGSSSGVAEAQDPSASACIARGVSAQQRKLSVASKESPLCAKPHSTPTTLSAGAA